MRHIRLTYSDEDWELLNELKEKSGKKWEDFFLALAKKKKARTKSNGNKSQVCAEALDKKLTEEGF